MKQPSNTRSFKIPLLLIGLIVVLGVGTFFGVARYTRVQLLKLFGERSFAFATFTMTEIDRSVQGNIARVDTLASRLSTEDVLRTSNETFELLEDRDSVIAERDTEWTALRAGQQNVLMEELISSNLSARLRAEFGATAISSNGTRFAPFTEVFLTNKYGANVAQTNRTSDYYQADEDWWQLAKEKGIHIDDVAFDESANTYSIDISVAITDGNGAFLGVVKVVWNVAEVIDLLQAAEFERREKRVFGDSTQLTLLTQDGRIIYSSEGNYNFLDQVDATVLSTVEALASSQEIYVLSDDNRARVTRFVTQARSTGFGAYDGLDWVLVYEQDTGEVLAPIRSTELFIGLIIGLFILCIVYMGLMYTKRIRSIQKLKDEFVSIAAHELKTPLTSAGWALDILADKRLSASVKEPFGILRESVGNMNKLVEDLLNMSRLESGRLEVKPEKQDVVQLVTDAVSKFQVSAKQKGQKINYLPADPIAVPVDSTMLNLILGNLLSNAIKYSPEGSQVDVQISTVDNYVQIAVQDHGMGIPKAEQDKIFTKFYRADNAKSSGTSGTGLGLFVIYHIVKGLGGDLRFTSVEGEGTTFLLDLPIEGMPAGKIKAY